jgi:hypothetical protein
MNANRNQILDSRIRVIFACAIDYSSWYDEDEERAAITEVTEKYSISTETVEKIRAWWFQEANVLLTDLEKAIVEFSETEGLDADEIETIEAQFESDMFGADLIMFLGMHLFFKPPSDEDIRFSSVSEVNDVDPEDLNPHFAKFLKSTIPVDVTVKFFDSPAGSKVLELV